MNSKTASQPIAMAETPASSHAARFSIVGIFFGTINFAVVNQGIYFTPFDRNWSSLIIGVMLLLAVLMNNTFRAMALSYSPKKK